MTSGSSTEHVVTSNGIKVIPHWSPYERKVGSYSCPTSDRWWKLPGRVHTIQWHPGDYFEAKQPCLLCLSEIWRVAALSIGFRRGVWSDRSVPQNSLRPEGIAMVVVLANVFVRCSALRPYVAASSEQCNSFYGRVKNRSDAKTAGMALDQGT